MMMVEAKTNSSFIGVGFVDEYICDMLIERFENDPKKGAGKIGGNDEEGRIVHEIKKSTDTSFAINEVPEYQEALSKCIKDYIEYFDPHLTDGLAPYGFTERVNIQKYLPSEGFYKWHFERSGPELTYRTLVFMTYLNDVPDGGTEFFHQGITTEAKKGLTVIWPTDWTHIHRGVISQTTTKYIATGWLGWIPPE